MKNILNILLNQIKSPLIYILFFALLVSIYFKEFPEIIVISTTIILNTILGFYQEYKAFSTFEKLKSLVKPTAIVEKNGEYLKINAEELQINDVIILNIDNSIPADAEIFEGELTVDEKVLTGESLPVTKVKGDIIYLGCSVVSGFCKAKVITIGKESRFGKIVKYVTEETEPTTPLQKQLSALGKFISIAILLITLIIFIYGYFKGYEISTLLKTSIALAVATVPEGLVVALTIILAVGMSKIVKQKAVVRKLIAAETLGSVTTICLDKTGTITEGNLKVHKSDINNFPIFTLINKFANLKIDTLEKAIDEWTVRNVDSKIENEYKIEKIIPFNSRDKYSGAIVTDNNTTYLLKYGAADVILESSKLSLGEREIIQSNLSSLAMQGIKLLGFAYKIITKDEFDKKIIDMNWIGYIGLSDSIRPDIRNIVKDSENAGVKIKLISGDNIHTTSAIAKEVGILDEEKTITTTGEIFHSLNLEQKREAVKNTIVFAKTTPMQKFEILKFLKDDYEVVAMIGDGVNDAPALKLADIGLVVNEASDISKDVADIVLLDSNFKTIVNAIKEGRIIFKNIQKVVYYLLMDSFSEVLLIASSIFLGLPLALSAIQILWINLIEDTLPALSLAFEPEEKNIMRTKPVKKGAKILDRKLQILMAIHVIITNGILITVQFYLSTISSDIVLNQTVIFSCLTFNSLLIIFSCKDLSRNIWEYNPFSNMYLYLSLLLSFILLLCSIYLPFLNKLLNTTPLSTSLLTLVFGAGISISIAFEIVKYIFQSLNESKHK